MKKIWHLNKKWNEIHRRNLYRRHRRKMSDDRMNKTYSAWKKITMPTNLSLQDESYRSKLIDKLSEIENSIQNKKKVNLCFSQTSTAHAEAMILLYSKIRKLVLDTHTRRIKINHSSFKSQKVKEALCQIGIYEFLGQRPPVTKTHDQDVVNWEFISGKDVNPESTAKLFQDDKTLPLRDDPIFSALTEAVANCVEHAYDDDATETANNGELWWAFRQVRDGELTLVICDLGIGIPKSLEFKHPHILAFLFNRVKEKALKKKQIDAYAIKEAITYSRSRHKDRPERGKGLVQIVDAINRYNEMGHESAVRIYSNHGLYQKMKHPKIQSDKENVITPAYRDSIGGTIISWRIPIPRQETRYVD